MALAEHPHSQRIGIYDPLLVLLTQSSTGKKIRQIFERTLLKALVDLPVEATLSLLLAVEMSFFKTKNARWTKCPSCD